MDNLYQEDSRSFQLLSRAKTLKEVQGQARTRVPGKVMQHLQLLLLRSWPSWAAILCLCCGRGRREEQYWAVEGVSQDREWKPLTKEYVKDESKCL